MKLIFIFARLYTIVYRKEKTVSIVECDKSNKNNIWFYRLSLSSRCNVTSGDISEYKKNNFYRKQLDIFEKFKDFVKLKR